MLPTLGVVILQTKSWSHQVLILIKIVFACKDISKLYFRNQDDGKVIFRLNKSWTRFWLFKFWLHKKFVRNQPISQIILCLQLYNVCFNNLARNASNKISNFRKNGKLDSNKNIFKDWDCCEILRKRRFRWITSGIYYFIGTEMSAEVDIRYDKNELFLTLR